MEMKWFEEFEWNEVDQLYGKVLWSRVMNPMKWLDLFVVIESFEIE